MREIPENSTPIINEVLEKLASIRLGCYEFNIVIAIIRKTWGWDKKTDWISGSQLSESTGILSTNCFKTVARLIKRRIILKDGRRLGLNKRTSQWLVSNEILSQEIVLNDNSLFKTQTPDLVSNEIVSQEIVDTIPGDSQVLSQEIHTKETITKDIITKEISKDITALPSKTKSFKLPVNAERVNSCLLWLAGELKLAAFGESQKEARQWAWHFIQLKDKQGAPEFDRKWRKFKAQEGFFNIRYIKKLYNLYKTVL